MQKTSKEKRSIFRRIKRQYSKGVRNIIHRKGYGVHSPYVFNFIIRVIEEKARYYAYDKIEEQYKQLKDQAKKGVVPKPQTLKYYKLLYRTLNRVKPQNVLECGRDCGLVDTIFLLANPDVQITRVEESDYNTEIPTYYTTKALPDLIYIHKQTEEGYKQIYNLLSSKIKETSVIIVSGIRSTKHSYTNFEEFASNKTIKVTIDIYDYAILVASPKLNKQTFKIGF